MGFASGVRAGTALVDSILQEKRASEEFGWKRGDRERTEAQRAEEDEALGGVRAEYDRMYGQRAGLPVPGSPVAPVVPGATAAPGVAQAQGDAGLRAGTAAGIPTEPVGAPAPTVPVGPANAAAAVAGTATAPTPAVQATPAAGPQGAGSEMSLERSLGRYALARRDVAGARESMKSARDIGLRDTINEGMKVPEKDMDTELAGLNTNLSNYPLLFTEKGKGGYEFLTVGENGQPGKKINLSAPQARQVLIAGRLAQSGYGTEALSMLSGVSKDLGETFKAYNDAQYKATTAGNTALHNANTEAETGRHNRATEGIASAHLGLARDKARSENNQILSAGKDGITMFDVKSGKPTRQPWPDGTTDEDKAAIIKKYRGEAAIPKVNSDGTVTIGERLFAENPDFGKKGKPNANQKYIDVTPGDSAFAKAFKADQAGTAAPAAAPAAPAAGLTLRPAAPAVPPRPLTQNEQALQAAAERQAAYDAEQRRQAGLELVRRSQQPYSPPTYGD